VTITQSLAEKYADLGVRTCVVRNMVPLDWFGDWEPPQREEDPVIVVSGVNSRDRHCDRLVRALPLICRRHPRARVRIMGRFRPGEFRAELGDIGGLLGVGANLDLLDSVPWRDNFSRVARATIGCVFYEDNENNRIGLPNRTFEYMFGGLPLLVSDFPELRRVIEDAQCGLAVDSAQPEAIAEGAIWLLDHPAEAQSMGRRGREAVLDRYHFERDLADLEEFYHAILK
jgi:glycosyltransferase involved in cell wall biosynthesis